MAADLHGANQDGANEEGAATASLHWSDFLTARDKEYLAGTSWTKEEPFGLGERPAVVVVDDYYEVLGTERRPATESLEKWPKSCGLEGWEAIDRTVEVIAAARLAGVPIIYITKMAGFNAPWGSRTPRAKASGRSEEEARLADEIVAEIAPEPGDLVLGKVAPSAFGGTPLSYWLNFHRIDTVLITGESTSGCVRATVVDAATLRLKVGVIADCCFDRLQGPHWISLFDMNQKYADVFDSAEAIEYLRGLPSGS